MLRNVSWTRCCVQLCAARAGGLAQRPLASFRIVDGRATGLQTETVEPESYRSERQRGREAGERMRSAAQGLAFGSEQRCGGWRSRAPVRPSSLLLDMTNSCVYLPPSVDPPPWAPPPALSGACTDGHRGRGPGLRLDVAMPLLEMETEPAEPTRAVNWRCRRRGQTGRMAFLHWGSAAGMARAMHAS